jgi:hypothetical protein
MTLNWMDNTIPYSLMDPRGQPVTASNDSIESSG